MATEASRGPVKRIVVNKNTAASHEIVAAVTGARIRILSLALKAAGAVDVTIEDEDGNDLIGLISMDGSNPFILPYSPVGWQETPKEKALHMLLGGAVQVGGVLVYQEVP